ARAQLLAAFGRDPVGRPGVVRDPVDPGVRAELLDARGHRVAHDLERRAAEKRGRELDADLVPRHVHGPDHAEVDERDDGDLRVRNLRERIPYLLFGYQVAPANERRTSVISAHRSASSGACWSRTSSSGRSSST